MSTNNEELEERLVELSYYVRGVIEDPYLFDFRQHELNQAPTQEIIMQAEQIWDAVRAIKMELDNREFKAVTEILENVETLLSQAEDNPDTFLESVIDKGKEIVKLVQDLLSKDPEYVAETRRAILCDTLQTSKLKLNLKEVAQILEEADKRVNDFLRDNKSGRLNFFAEGAATPPPGSRLHEVTRAFDDCLHAAYQQFLKGQPSSHAGQRRKNNRLEILLVQLPNGTYEDFIVQLKKSLKNLDSPQQLSRSKAKRAG